MARHPPQKNYAARSTRAALPLLLWQMAGPPPAAPRGSGPRGRLGWLPARAAPLVMPPYAPPFGVKTNPTSQPTVDITPMPYPCNRYHLLGVRSGDEHTAQNRLTDLFFPER